MEAMVELGGRGRAKISSEAEKLRYVLQTSNTCELFQSGTNVHEHPNPTNTKPNSWTQQHDICTPMSLGVQLTWSSMVSV